MYCVYLTEYSGSRLPRFYVGSTTCDKIAKGYRGSVASKEFRNVWAEEVTNNPHLFRTIILSTHETRKEALDAEFEWQSRNNVVLREDYINKSLCRKNGFFGMDVSGEKNPMYGTSRSGEKHSGGENISRALKEFYKTEKGKSLREKITARKPMLGKTHSDETKRKMSEKRKGEKNGMYGRKHSEETKHKLRLQKLGKPSWNKGKKMVAT